MPEELMKEIFVKMLSDHPSELGDEFEKYTMGEPDEKRD